MASFKNHHYVPQFYFRLFNGGRRDICVFQMRKACAIAHASVKGQCAKSKFYACDEIETKNGELEQQHSRVLRALVSAAENSETSLFSYDFFPLLLQAVIFQRARTMLEVEKQWHAHEQLLRDILVANLKCGEASESATEAISGLESGKFKLTQSPTATVLQQIRIALDAAPLLLDMDVRVLRNWTSIPSIFSDSPVVFFNARYRNVKNRGVLGLQSPGLLIFYPLTPQCQLMLIDADAYHGSFKKTGFCDISTAAQRLTLSLLAA